jgi:nucleoid DNA-binding protein
MSIALAANSTSQLTENLTDNKDLLLSSLTSNSENLIDLLNQKIEEYLEQKDYLILVDLGKITLISVEDLTNQEISIKNDVLLSYVDIDSQINSLKNKYDL